MIREANDANQEAGAAQPTALPACDWDFCSIAELTRALQSRRISASELLEHTIARIEVLFAVGAGVPVKGWTAVVAGGLAMMAWRLWNLGKALLARHLPNWSSGSLAAFPALCEPLHQSDVL